MVEGGVFVIGMQTENKNCNLAIDTILKVLDNIKKNTTKGVQLIGFGSFAVVERKARKGRNPQTGEVIKIKASKAVKFKAGTAYKESVK